jgi:hypothetical protein
MLDSGGPGKFAVRAQSLHPYRSLDGGCIAPLAASSDRGASFFFSIHPQGDRKHVASHFSIQDDDRHTTAITTIRNTNMDLDLGFSLQVESDVPFL